MHVAVLRAENDHVGGIDPVSGAVLAAGERLVSGADKKGCGNGWYQ